MLVQLQVDGMVVRLGGWMVASLGNAPKIKPGISSMFIIR